MEVIWAHHGVVCPRVMFTLIVNQILLAGVPFKRIHSLCFFLLVQKYLISIACESCCLMVLLAISTDVALSQWMGFGVVGCRDF